MTRSYHSLKNLPAAVLGAVFVGLLTLAGPMHALPEGAAISTDFQLRDQFGVIYGPELLDGQVTILIGGNRKAGDHSRTWARQIRNLLATDPELEAGVRVLQVADLRGVPRIFEPAVTGQLANRYAASVLMDWDGDLSGRYSFLPKVANVVVVDRQGEAVFRLESTRPGTQDSTRLQVLLLALQAAMPEGCGESEPETTTLGNAGGQEAGIHDFWREML